MKIAIWHNLPSGGGKRALYDQVEGLVKRGHSIEVWSPDSIDASFLPLAKMAPEHILPLSRRRSGRFETYAPWKRLREFNEIRALMEAHCSEAARQIEQEEFDLLFAHSCRFFAVGAIARHVKRIPTVLYLQEPHRRLYEARPNPPFALRGSVSRSLRSPREAWRLFDDILTTRARRAQITEEVRNAAAFRLILVNSLFSRESVLRAYGLDSTVCYLGVNPDKFRPSYGRRDPYVVGVGAIQPRKNIELAIQAVGTIETRRPKLIWVGNKTDPGYLATLRQLARSNSVDFEPREAVGDDELIDVLTHSTAMIYTPRLEPFGLSALEAMACGIPVVAVAEGGVRESVVDGVNGLLTEHDAGAIGNAVVRLLEEPALAERLGRQARALVESTWSLDHSIRRLEALLGGVVSSEKPEHLAVPEVIAADRQQMASEQVAVS
jgi:glycosyltransferase involved in cell wall biosynthesis